MAHRSSQAPLAASCASAPSLFLIRFCTKSYKKLHFGFLSGDTVFVHGAAATPLPLLESLAQHGKTGNLKDVKLIHIHTEGPGICQKPEFNGGFLKLPAKNSALSVALINKVECERKIDDFL